MGSPVRDLSPAGSISLVLSLLGTVVVADDGTRFFLLWCLPGRLRVHLRQSRATDAFDLETHPKPCQRLLMDDLGGGVDQLHLCPGDIPVPERGHPWKVCCRLWPHRPILASPLIVSQPRILRGQRYVTEPLVAPVAVSAVPGANMPQLYYGRYRRSSFPKSSPTVCP